MKLIATSMYDNITNSYSDIKLYVNEEHAKREYCATFIQCADKPFINDIDIKQIGSFDLSTGEFVPELKHIAKAKEVLEYGKE